jgi:hypothetical protein
MDATNNIATDLFYKVRSRFQGLKLGNETGEITINPEEARFFDFDYMEGQNPIGHVSISLAEPSSMKVYFSAGITEAMDGGQKNNWYKFLKELRMFAKRRLMAFDTRDISKDNLDKRDYAFLSQANNPQKQNPNTIVNRVGESIMSESTLYGSKTMSYQKLMDTRLIIKHSQTLADDMQPGARSRNISALFVENQDGERFKYPFIHLSGARAMQRHVANGGVPYDDIGKSITSMSEEIAQLKSFSNYVVRNDLMNSGNNGIVERSQTQLANLREQMSKLAKQSHYEAYKESFQVQAPMEVPEDVVEQFTDQFTVRNFKEDIKSVFPVLYRLMKESEIGYNDIVEMTSQDAVEAVETVGTDPFSRFESWVMELGEASAITSQDPEEQQLALQKLQELVGQHFPAGMDGSNAIESLKGIIEDPQLFQAIKEQSKQDPDSCVRGLVKEWLQQNAPDTLEQLDFGDFVEEPAPEDPMQYANDAADADAEYYGQQGESIDEAASPGDYEIDGDMATVEFERDESGTPRVTKVMIGSTDITAIADLEAMVDAVDPDAESPMEDVYIILDVDVDSEYNAAERGSREQGSGMQLEPDYDAYSEITSVVAYGNGNKVNIYTDELPDSVQEQLQKIADGQHEGDDDGYDDYDRYEGMEKDNSSQETGNKLGANIQELAEFIHTFYDRDSGTFPKGPEGVCTMVGKKFGEQAEQVARKFVERMAPQQADPQIAELSRIKQLSGIGQGIGM